jgi:hypothetical protein
MTTDQWIGIAGITSTVGLIIVTSLLTIVTFAALKEQQRISPSDKHEDGRFIRFLESPWIKSPWRLPPLTILPYLLLLFLDLRRTDPLSRGAVIEIAFHMAGVLWGALLVLTNSIGQEQKSQWDTIRESFWPYSHP